MKKRIIWIVMLGILVSFSCKEADLINPLDDVLQISCDKERIKTGGDTVTITVTGYDTKTGKPLPDNTLVMFETTLGTLSSTSVKLFGGQGSITLTSDSKSGTAEIRANAQNLWATPNPLTITIEEITVGQLILSASPSALPSGGGTARIIVYLRDDGGNPMNGIFVSLHTTEGFLHSGGGHISNSDGRVEDTLETSVTAIVTATAESMSNNIVVFVLEDNENRPPKALFSYLPYSPQIGDVIYFDAGASFDNDGHIVFYEWNFGDGSKFNGSAKQVPHTYTAAGNYNVTLTVIDDQGAEDTSQGTVTVSAGAMTKSIKVQNFTIGSGLSSK